jgi:uncharacterized protein YggE
LASSLGTAIDDVVNATGNAAQVNSLTFSFASPAVVQYRARTAAVHQAVAHAEAMARRGRPQARSGLFAHRQHPAHRLQDGQGFDIAALPASGVSALPIEPGTQIQSGEVTMVYALGR